MSSFDATRADSGLPPVDERLAVPETRYEVVDGKLVYVPPADGPHGTRHSKISALVEAHADLEFEVASDMLTRTSKIDDVAPDVSVFPRAPHPTTGRRQLEHLAFEVVSTGTLRAFGKKARKLSTRGVRRVFAIHVKRACVLEWSRARKTWIALDPAAHIEDPALAVSLPIDALVHAAKADDAMARALLLKRNPVLEAARAQDVAQATAQGRADAVLVVLATRGISLAPDQRARILSERDPARLARWIARATTCTNIAELFAER